MKKPDWKLKNIRGLAEELGIPARTCRTLQEKGAIPFYKLGWRLVLFDPDKVREALGKFEVKAARTK